MPVLITIATLALLFGGESGANGFLDPKGLKKRMRKALADGATRDAALERLDALVDVAKRYQDLARSTVEDFAAQAGSGTFTEESLVELHGPLDAARVDAFREILRIREEIRALLSREEWERVFD
ncbi:MAG: hypothetical protein AAGB93_00285 [Planctomycetota bacterium]